MKPEELYMRLGRLIESMPRLDAASPPPELLKWLGDAYALVKATNDISAAVDIKFQIDTLTTHGGMGGFSLERHEQAAKAIPTLLYRALAVAELAAPAANQGSFIPAGNSFDAIGALSKVFNTAAKSVLIIDPYLDEKVLLEYASMIPSGVSIKLMADEAFHKPSLIVAAKRWVQQNGQSMPLEVRLSEAKKLHDRLIIIDSAQAWILTQSLNAFATRSPATIVHYPDENGLKIGSYLTIWDESKSAI